MPATQADYNKIKTLQEQAASLTKQGAGMEASSVNLGDKVMEAVRADRVSRGVSKLSTDVGNVSGQMVSDPTGIRERTSGVVNPLDVNALTSSARAQNLRTLGTISTQQTLNQQPIDEVIQAGANQLTSRAKNLYAQAEEAQAQADALNQEWERQMAERKQAWDEYYQQQQLNIDNAKLTPGGAIDIPGVGSVSQDVLQGAIDVINGGDIKNISFAGNLRGNVQSFVSYLINNPKVAESLSINPLSSVDQPTFEAVSKLGYIQDAQKYLNKTGGTGYTGSLQKYLSQRTGIGGEEADTFWNLFSRLGAKELFDIGGKTLPAQEKGEITPFIPREDKDPQANVKSLDRMYATLYNEAAAEIAEKARKRGIPISDAQIKEYINKQLTNRKSLFPTLNSEWEIVGTE